MRQGLLLDLLFRTPAIPPSVTLAAIILDRIFRILRLPPILGNIDTGDQDEVSMRKRRSFSDHSRSFKKRPGFSDTRKRLFGGRGAPVDLDLHEPANTGPGPPPRLIRRPDSIAPEDDGGQAPQAFASFKRPESVMPDEDDNSDRASASWV